LNHEDALLQKIDGNYDFELRAADAGRVRYDTDECTVAVLVGNAYDQSWSYLGCDSEINEPDLAALRRPALPPRRGRGRMRPIALHSRLH